MESSTESLGTSPSLQPSMRKSFLLCERLEAVKQAESKQSLSSSESSDISSFWATQDRAKCPLTKVSCELSPCWERNARDTGWQSQLCGLVKPDFPVCNGEDIFRKICRDISVQKEACCSTVASSLCVKHVVTIKRNTISHQNA